MKVLTIFLLGLCVLLVQAPGASAQDRPEIPVEKSAGKALILSLVVPGLGQRYLHDEWTRAAVLFTAADVSLWLGLAGAGWQQRHLVQSYTTLAAGRARADVEDKNRLFFISMANYASSDHFVEALLRERRWDRLEEARRPSHFWEWQSESDWQRYRSVREEAESLRRQRPLLISLLVANRLLAGVSALRTAASVSFLPPAVQGGSPQVHVQYRW